MSDRTFPEESQKKTLHRLILFRVAIVTFLLGITAFVQIEETGPLPPSALRSVYWVVSITYLLSFFYAILPRAVGDFKVNVYIQALGDVVLVTTLVCLTGGSESSYSVLYPLIVIYSALFLERRGGYTLALACSLAYGLSLYGEYYGVFYGISTGRRYMALYVFLRVFVNAASFFVVALLTSFVVEREKKLRVMLEEREDAFNQLDVLHRSIIESVDTGILTLNLRGEIKSFNRAAEEITGYRFREVRNRPVEDIFPGVSVFLGEERDGAGKRGMADRLELEFDRGQERKTIGFASSALRDGKGDRIGRILIFQDLTARKEMEKEVERSKRLALLGEMTACFAHEMRNPLASISGSVQMLRRELDLGETEERLMKIILRGRDQLESLLKDFLLLARPGGERREKVDVPEVIRDVLESIRFSSEWNEAITVVNEAREAVPVLGNRQEIRQVIWNLVLNAVQAMPEGGCVGVRTSTVQKNGMIYLAVEVSDQGDGVQAEDPMRVFEPFFTTREKGTGLGLTVVKRITESHGGAVGVESRPGRGSTFTLLFPGYEG
ncbi:MAG TPA: ATP-binding protein [Syntrophales bacterium]|nr:ATP-binding protein [Syntrophales bacterium]